MNPARPKPGHRLCQLAELEDPGSQGFIFRQDRSLFAGFVVRLGDRVYGYVDSCPHAGWPLGALSGSYLTREKDLILCAGHAALFRREDGRCLSGPCAGEHLVPWPVEIVDCQVVTA